MKIMAIDGSTKSTGVAIYDDTKLIHYECITASSTNLHRRIQKMASEIERLHKEYKIDIVYMEDVLPEDVKSNRKVFKALIYLQAKISETVNEFKQEIEFRYPSEWRATCGITQGRGVLRTSQKQLDIQFVKDNFGIDANDDICDAICLGWAATHEKKKIILEGGFELG